MLTVKVLLSYLRQQHFFMFPHNLNKNGTSFCVKIMGGIKIQHRPNRQ